MDLEVETIMIRQFYFYAIPLRKLLPIAARDLPIDSGRLSNRLGWEAMDIKNWLCSLPHLNTEKNTEPKSHPEIKEVE